MEYKRIILFFSILFLFACKEKETSYQEDSNIQALQKENPTKVKTISIGVKIIQGFISGQGKIKPFKEQVMEAQLNGAITYFIGYNGKSVTKNDRLPAYDKRTIELRNEKAKNNLDQSKLEFQSQLLGFSIQNKRLADSVLLKLRAASGLSNAEVDAKEIALEIEKSSIYAPFNGKLANVIVQEGQYVKAGDNLFTIYSHKELYFEIYVLEVDIKSINIDQPATIMPIANTFKTYAAKVFEINPMVNENGMVLVKLKLLETSGLLPGMNATGTIRIPLAQTLVIPKEALVRRNDKTVVFTAEGGYAKWNDVTTGVENGIDIEIKTGLSPGQKIIVSNNLQLTQGTPIIDEL